MSQSVTIRISLLLAGLLAPAAARAQVLESVDHKGSCYGVPEKSGTTSHKGKVVALEAYGSEFGHHCQTDQGRFAFQEMEGDFDVSARVVTLGNDKKTAAKACLMVREVAEDPAARFAAIMAVSDLPFARRHDHAFPDSFTFDFRVDRGGNLGKGGFRYKGQDLKERRRYPNVWLRLQRRGDRITSFISKDGKRWTEASPDDSWINVPSFPLGKRVAVGLCLSSEPEVKPDIRAFATFDNLRGFRPNGPARLPTDPKTPVASPAAFTALPITPRVRPMGLGKPIPAPLMKEKFPDLTGGEPRTLADVAGEKGTLLVFTSSKCALPEAAPKRLAALARPFESKGVRAVLVQPDGAPPPAKLGSMPILQDREGALARALGAINGGQAFLFDKSGKLVYSGAAVGLDLDKKRRPFLKAALTAVAAGEWPEVAQSPAPDCPLTTN